MQRVMDLKKFIMNLVCVFNDDEYVPSNSEDFEEEYEYTDKDINAICIN